MRETTFSSYTPANSADSIVSSNVNFASSSRHEESTAVLQQLVKVDVIRMGVD